MHCNLVGLLLLLLGVRGYWVCLLAYHAWVR